MAKAKKIFQVGDKVRAPYDGAIRTVTWVSKCGELIATEYNGYFNGCDTASTYEAA